MSGTLTLSDVDGPGGFVAQAGTRGLYGTFTLAGDGSWTYTMDGPHKEFAAGQTYTDAFSVASNDGTARSNAVTVTITGTAEPGTTPPTVTVLPPSSQPPAATDTTAPLTTPPGSDPTAQPSLPGVPRDGTSDSSRDTRLVDPVLQGQPVNIAGGVGAAGSDAGGSASQDALSNLSSLINALPPTAAGGSLDSGIAGAAGNNPITGLGSANLQSSDPGFPVARLTEDAAAKLQFANDAPSTGSHRLFVYEGVSGAAGDNRYQLPQDAFAHTDPAAIVKLDARKVNGEPLPPWVQFDPVAGVFSGTPPTPEASALDVMLTARDIEGREASVVFKLNLGETSSAPALPGAAPAGASPAGADAQPAGQPLSSGLPGAETVRPSTGAAVSGEGPGFADSSAKFAPEFGPGGPSSELDSSDRGFPVTRVSAANALQLAGTGLEARLFVYQGVREAQADAEFRIPRDAFAHTDPAAVVRLEARLSNGQPLPTWLSFDGISGTFRGTPPSGVSGLVELELIARDRDGREAVVDFKLEMGVPDAPAKGAGAEADESFILGEGKLPKEQVAERPAGEKGQATADKAKAQKQPVKRAAASFNDQIKATQGAKDPLLAKVLEAKAKARTTRL